MTAAIIHLVHTVEDLTLTSKCSDNYMVSISKDEYEELLERDMWLHALESAGVDNWSGIDYAREEYEEMNEAIQNAHLELVADNSPSNVNN